MMKKFIFISAMFILFAAVLPLTASATTPTPCLNAAGPTECKGTEIDRTSTFATNIYYEESTCHTTWAASGTTATQANCGSKFIKYGDGTGSYCCWTNTWGCIDGGIDSNAHEVRQNCTWAVCGNNIKEGKEECDGTDAQKCPGRCNPPDQFDVNPSWFCTCSVCGDGVIGAGEQCEKTVEVPQPSGPPAYKYPDNCWPAGSGIGKECTLKECTTDADCKQYDIAPDPNPNLNAIVGYTSHCNPPGSQYYPNECSRCGNYALEPGEVCERNADGTWPQWGTDANGNEVMCSRTACKWVTSKTGAEAGAPVNATAGTHVEVKETEQKIDDPARTQQGRKQSGVDDGGGVFMLPIKTVYAAAPSSGYIIDAQYNLKIVDDLGNVVAQTSGYGLKGGQALSAVYTPKSGRTYKPVLEIVSTNPPATNVPKSDCTIAAGTNYYVNIINIDNPSVACPKKDTRLAIGPNKAVQFPLSSFPSCLTGQSDCSLVLSSVVYGDVNQNYSFSMADINALTDIILGRVAMPVYTNYKFVAGNVNGDGKLDTADLNLFVDKLLGRIKLFPVETPACTDTDFGQSAAVKGTATSGGVSKTDQCVDAKTLTEYYCFSSGVQSTAINCTLNGYTGCLNGACVVPATQKPKAFAPVQKLWASISGGFTSLFKNIRSIFR